VKNNNIYRNIVPQFRHTSTIIGGQHDHRNCVRRVWRNQRGNQNPYIEEEQTKQCPKEKV